MANNALIAWLDKPVADRGLTPSARQELSSILSTEYAYQRFADIVLKPPPAANVEIRAKRSWRALQALSHDMKSPAAGFESILMNPSRAGLLAKEIFSSLQQHHETEEQQQEFLLLHVRTLLENLLEAYPSSVVSAAAAGGTKGMDQHLGPLLSAQTSSHTLPTVTHLVLYGCTGKAWRASAERTLADQQQQQQLQLQQQRVAMRGNAISHGHRRKFLRNLTEWGFLSRLIVDCMDEHEINPTVGEDVCESILTIVECLGYPSQDMVVMAQPPTTEKKKQESIGEQAFLAPLGKPEWWDPLVAKVSPQSSEATKVAATRVMMGIFTLATGRSSRIRKTNTPILDASEANLGGDQDQVKVNEQQLQQQKKTEHKNKLREWGLTSKIHASLIAHLAQLAQALQAGRRPKTEPLSSSATTYLERGTNHNDTMGVPHPGRCRIIPFTSWRLHVIALFTEIVTWKEPDEGNHDDHDDEKASLRHKAMSAVMELALPPEMRKDKDGVDNNDDDDAILNPWPALCDWVFEYPENSLYHYQFIRLLQAICMEHHEQSLRVVLQKAKFVSRAVKSCKPTGPLRGVLLTCLNILRLRSVTLPPRAFLRQFLESHDAWKAFQETLCQLTIAQQKQSRPIPGKEALFDKSGEIDLGSFYSAQLGFNGFTVYQEDSSAGPPPSSSGGGGDEGAATTGGKKKKKKRKKKK